MSLPEDDYDIEFTRFSLVGWFRVDGGKEIPATVEMEGNIDMEHLISELAAKVSLAGMLLRLECFHQKLNLFLLSLNFL